MAGRKAGWTVHRPSLVDRSLLFAHSITSNSPKHPGNGSISGERLQWGMGWTTGLTDQYSKKVSLFSVFQFEKLFLLSKLPITQFILISGSSGSPYRVVQIKKKYGWSIFVIRSLQVQLTKDQKQPYNVASQLLKGFRFWLGLGSGLAAIIQIQ